MNLPKKRRARSPVIANRTWRVDERAVDQHLMHIEVTGPRPRWTSDLAELFAAIAAAIESGSPDARAWAIAQLRTVAMAFDPDGSFPKGI